MILTGLIYFEHKFYKEIRLSKNFKPNILILGLIEIIIGSISFAFGVITLALLESDWPRDVAPSVWIGCWWVLTGVLGVIAAGRNSKKLFMNLHLAAIIIAGVLATFAALFYIWAFM